jgi:hypothetical protein
VKRVYGSLNRLLVHHARNLLEAEGIEATVLNENMAGAMGELPFLDCEVELWVVDESRAARAAEILRYGPLSPLEKDAGWRCGCGEFLEPQFTQCWQCGAARTA